MKKKNVTKHALLASVLAMVLCVTMLVGTTFAWFTDTASAKVNQIKSGKLDVDIVDTTEAHNSLTKDNQVLSWQKAEGHENDEVLWEPGCTYNLTSFQIANKGNLNLKYKVVISGAKGDLELLNAIDFTYKIGDGESQSAANGATIINDASLNAGEEGTATYSDVITITGTMKTTAGNEYQNKTLEGIAITVYATQETGEYDSNNNTYDQGAAGDEFKQAVTVKGVAGVADSYASIQEAYEAVKQRLTEKCGLSEEPLSEEEFNKFFTDGGKITWTIYGNQKVTDTRIFSFGRSANRFGEGRHITEIDIVGGNSTAALDLSATKGTFALPYNWWNVTDSVNTELKCRNITFNAITSMPSAIYQCTLYPTTYDFDGCTFNGNLYSYQNFDVQMTIKNCTFHAPAAATKYAFMSQGQGGTITLDHNTFNGYTRGINMERPTADFIVTNNTIRSTVSEADRAAIQLTDGKSFVVTGNLVDVNAGNAFWFHNAAKNAGVTYTISENDIKAPYIGYSGVTSFDVNEKITSSGNKFNSTDTTKCMKKGATAAEATNLTAIR